MTLSRFATVMPRAVEAVLSTAEALRHIRNTQGDLPWWAIDRVQDGLAQSKEACLAALAEGQRQPVNSEEFMRSLGGPATLADFQAKIMACETAAAAWNTRLAALLADLSGPELIALIRRGEGMMATSHVERVPFLSAGRADGLRSSDELASLIAAFEAVGA
jgi:hypothetical protein